jgi:hypothetical protein
MIQIVDFGKFSSTSLSGELDGVKYFNPSGFILDGCSSRK